MKERNISFKVVAFWTAFVAITLIFLVVFGMRIFKVTTFDSYDDFKKANLLLKGNIAGAEEDTYYVYIYSERQLESDYEYAEVEPTIFTYFTYVAKNGSKDGVAKIYAYNTDTFTSVGEYNTVNAYLESLNSNLKTSSLPALVKFNGVSVNNVFTQINKIESELQGQMK